MTTHQIVLIKQAFECSQVAIRVLFDVIKKFLWWKPLSLSFKPLQTTAGMLLEDCSHHKQHICAGASWFSTSPADFPGTAEQRPLLWLPLLEPGKRCAIANYRADGGGLCCTVEDTILQMWGPDGEWCKTAAARRFLVNLAVKQFEEHAPVLLAPALGRASAGDTSGWIWQCRIGFHGVRRVQCQNNSESVDNWKHMAMHPHIG